MRHRVYGRKLGRNKNQREGLFKSLVQSLLTHGTITTSEAKAKAIKGMVDRIISLAKNKNTQYLLQSYLVNRDLRERLVKEIIPKLENRVSGFTTLVRIGTRKGDQTTLVKMSIIGNEKLKPLTKKSRVKSQESGEKAEKKVLKKTQAETKKVATKRKPVKITRKGR
ncbi:50S ribosomal protein L17 [Candidatus Daviesbacteria bacterium RIFCSPHIGHO2_02_FULL_39_12]|uniref:50S ribosomal protein L17 n=2 Tax=Candidatus Daviesiibacteriota TaxID=1752718 RepID=A0A1F5JD51_9BACT|nr:MAG: 50S ribosomal protein L17 [Candidatus Daviesbacteria bacterium RIFCSPHIGHO2_02_FULL_39_12]OGE72618.1 MAG: 50S ribosomal protein L17 [Candidatus Daviesbacteria bacterium RIFCSPLOWO2_02_FULL_38_15]